MTDLPPEGIPEEPVDPDLEPILPEPPLIDPLNPFAALQAQLVALTGEIAQFNAQAPKLTQDVNKLGKRTGWNTVFSVITSIALVIAVTIAYLAINDARDDREANDYAICLRGNEFRTAVVGSFDTALTTILGPAPPAGSPQQVIDRYEENKRLQEQVIEDIGNDPRIAPRACTAP